MMIFNWLAGLLSNDLAIDLGTANTLVYAKGRGIEKNSGEARKWYERAAEQGNERAEEALARLQESKE